MSKFSFDELEYFLARRVTGQIALKMSNTIPSSKIIPTPIQTHFVILLLITA